MIELTTVSFQKVSLFCVYSLIFVKPSECLGYLQNICCDWEAGGAKGMP